MESDPYELRCQGVLMIILIAMPSPAIGGAILLVLLLLYASAMISGSEIAFFSLTHNDFAKLEDESSRSAKRILKLKES